MTKDPKFRNFDDLYILLSYKKSRVRNSSSFISNLSFNQ